MQLQKISTLTNLLNLLFVYIQGSPPLCQLLFPNKPRTQTFLTLQSDEPEKKNFVFIITQLSDVKIQQSSELLLCKCLVYSFTSLIL